MDNTNTGTVFHNFFLAFDMKNLEYFKLLRECLI